VNRRNFILTSVLSGVALSAAKAASADTIKKEDLCVMTMDHVAAEATHFARYEHFHVLTIPIVVLIAPPAAGYKVRTSTLDQDSLDEKAFAEFIKDSGLDASSLRVHSHEVNFTQAELERIATGEKEVQITVATPKGNLAHKFFFTAPRSAIVKIQRGRAVKKA
jgi:hypothetical protein